MSNELTDRSFWTNYWESKQGLVFPIRANYLFHEQLSTIVKEEKVKTAIELGGFPGYYTIFLKKYLGLQACLLDYFVHPGIIGELCQVNGLSKSDIEVVETDLFAYQADKKYDLVLSCGLIEHFKNTRDIIERHVALLKPGGTLFITLPNFRGLNGWFQQHFDRENYDKHEIACMDPELLKKLTTELGLEVQQAKFYGGFSIWLENYQKQSLAVKLFMKVCWFTGKVFSKIFRFESRAFSPYILLEAKSAA